MMKMPKSASTVILNQLLAAISQLRDDEYSRPLNLLSGNTIGKHTRHIIGFYLRLEAGYDTGVVDYDARHRDVRAETSVIEATRMIKNIIRFVDQASDKTLTLDARYPGNGQTPFSCTSSFSRELIYNIEHAIHHMAIIKIALAGNFKTITLPENFGVAFSTIEHLNESCAP